MTDDDFGAQRGQQGEPLHHQQDPAGRPDALPHRRSNVPRPAGAAVVLPAALPGHDAAHAARAQARRTRPSQIRLRRQRKSHRFLFSPNSRCQACNSL